MKRILALAALLAPAPVLAHLGGVPTTAFVVSPDDVGLVVDDVFTVAWTDYDDLAETQDTLIDVFYTAEMPPTFRVGTSPDTLNGIAIAKEIPELDPVNALEWDVSAVPSGSYFIFTVAHDPPFRIAAFSRGVVTVAHEGDPVHPAVMLLQPDGIKDVGRGTYSIEWKAFDPDGTGTIRIEGTMNADGTGLRTIAEGLDPAAGAYEWQTDGWERGDWMLRISLEDARGLSHTAWSRYFVRVADPIPNTGGTGGAAGAVGAGGAPGGDAGAGGGATPGGAGGARRDPGSGCAHVPALPSLLGLALAVAALRRR